MTRTSHFRNAAVLDGRLMLPLSVSLRDRTGPELREGPHIYSETIALDVGGINPQVSSQ
jgi:hypothetical protein